MLNWVEHDKSFITSGPGRFSRGVIDTIQVIAYIRMSISTLDRFLMVMFVCLFDLILYVPSTIFQLNRDGSSWLNQY